MTRPGIMLGAPAISILSALDAAQHVITSPGWGAQF